MNRVTTDTEEQWEKEKVISQTLASHEPFVCKLSPFVLLLNRHFIAHSHPQCSCA